MSQKAVLPLSGDPEDLLREAFRLKESIQAATEQINRWNERYGMILEELGSHEITEAGIYRIEPRVRSRRVVNVSRLKELYPKEYDKVVKNQIAEATKYAGISVNLKEIEKYLGTEQMKDIVDKKESVTFSVVKTAEE